MNPKCTVDGCDRPTRTASASYCNPHYKRWLRNGTPGSGVIAPPPGQVRGADHHAYRGATVSYSGAHYRVRAARGSAADLLCACGAQADQWAYDHTDPNELTAVNDKGITVPYSTDPTKYVPMCRPCHARFDVRKVSE